MRGLEPHQPVPGRRDPHRAAGVGADRRAPRDRAPPPPRCPSSSRPAPARASCALGGVAVIGFTPSPEKASSDRCVLPRQTSPRPSAAPARGVALRHAPASRRVPASVACRRVDIVLPGERDAVERGAAPPRARAAAGRGLGTGALGRQAGIDAVAVGVASAARDSLRQVARVEPPVADRAPLVRRRHPQCVIHAALLLPQLRAWWTIGRARPIVKPMSRTAIRHRDRGRRADRPGARPGPFGRGLPRRGDRRRTGRPRAARLRRARLCGRARPRPGCSTGSGLGAGRAQASGSPGSRWARARARRSSCISTRPDRHGDRIGHGSVEDRHLRGALLGALAPPGIAHLAPGG